MVKIMVMMMVIMRRGIRHLSVKPKRLVKSLEEPMANAEAAVRPSLATLIKILINFIF